MMYCSECGTEHSREAKSCPKWGNPNPHVAGKLSAGIMIGIFFISAYLLGLLFVRESL